MPEQQHQECYGRFNEPHITCPYCGWINQDSWDMSVYGETECPECERKFSYERDIVYHTRPIK